MSMVLLDRRVLLSLIGAAAAGLVGGRSVAQELTSCSAPEKSKLILLGTGGGPVLGGERRMMSSVIVVNGSAYLIDCGYGAAEGLSRADVPIKDIGSIFITHNHADHVLDYGSILFFEWLQGRSRAIDVYGPSPLKEITTDLLKANAVPVDYYRQDSGAGPMPLVMVHEMVAGGPVMRDRNVRVSCTTVHHPPVIPTFAYRFDLDDRSIVFSGDTSPSEQLVALAKGADMLVHEAAEAELAIAVMTAAAQSPGSAPGNGAGSAQPKGFNVEKYAQHVYNAHSSAEDAGRVAAAAGVKTLVLSHIYPSSSRIVSDARWMQDAGRHFSGKIVVGHDGMIL